MNATIDLRAYKSSDRAITDLRRLGLIASALGVLIAAMVAWLGLSAVQLLSDGEDVQSTSALAFGLNTTALATVKVAIGITLMAIVIAAWRRADAVRDALLSLAVVADRQSPRGAFTSLQGPAVEQVDEPEPLLIHRLARLMWAPMLAMGYMLVLAGLGAAIWWARSDTTDSVIAAAWTQSTQFLGEGLLLAGVSFLLGTVLYVLRTGGGAAQAAIGAPVQTLRMPWTAKAFIGLMVAGVMVSVGQFIGYLLVAAGTWSSSAFLWLGPVREVGLGLLLSGIVLALATIATVLSFQFGRVSELLVKA